MSGFVGVDFGRKASAADLIRQFLVIYCTVEFKGTVSRDGNFFEGLNFLISTLLSVYALMVF
jgi:hypothetical protein